MHGLSKSISLLLIGSLIPISSWGQSTNFDTKDFKAEESIKIEKKKKKSSGAVEKIKVTGSHIKRIDIEGPSPVQVLDRDDLDRTGYNSVGDVLRDITAASFGSPREASGSSVAGVASVSLRGLGSTRTLVLMNGKRLPTDAISGSVDLNLIPMAAIERIEVLKDGASATYGSDALGGVVNLITRKDYDGAEVSISQSTTALGGGNKFEVNGVAGFTSGKVNMVNVIQHRKNDEVFANTRKWSDDGVSPTGSPGSHRAVNPDGTTGPWIVADDCPPDMIQDLGAAGKLCRYRYTDFSTSQPSIQQQSLMSETNFKMREGTNVKLRVTGTQKKTFWQYAPSPGQFEADASAAAGLGLPGVAPGDSVQFRYRLVELGNRQSEIETNAFNVITGFSQEIGESWEMEFDTAINRVFRNDVGVDGYALEDVVNQKIKDGEFVPANKKGERGDISAAKYQPYQRNMSELLSNELKFSGELVETGNGAPITMALGFTNTHQEYSDDFDNESLKGNVIGSAGSAGGGTRDTNSVFMEFGVPLATNLEMQLAGRYDNYSDFGETTNPKLAFLYRPTQKLMLRASGGTGFKAPNMVDLYATEGYGWPTMIDERLCYNQKRSGGPTPACAPAQYLAKFGGNEDLQEERSENYSMGAVYQASRDTNMGFDLFYTKMNNVVGVDYAAIMEADARGIDLNSKGIIVDRNKTTGEIELITAPNQNLSAQELYGIDLSFGQKLTSQVSLKIEHSHLFFYKYAGVEGLPFENIVGENGAPPWRNNITLTYSPMEQMDTSLVARTVAEHEKTRKEFGDLKQYTEYDLQLTYASQQYGKFGAGIKNLLGSTPPLDDSDVNNQLVRSLYSDLGQTAYVSYAKNF